MKNAHLVLLFGLVLIACPASAQDSYSDGYSAAVQNMNAEPPASSSPAYYGYHDAQDDMRNEYDQRHQTEAEPEQPSYGSTPQMSGSGASANDNE